MHGAIEESTTIRRKDEEEDPDAKTAGVFIETGREGKREHACKWFCHQNVLRGTLCWLDSLILVVSYSGLSGSLFSSFFL